VGINRSSQYRNGITNGNTVKLNYGPLITGTVLPRIRHSADCEMDFLNLDLFIPCPHCEDNPSERPKKAVFHNGVFSIWTFMCHSHFGFNGWIRLNIVELYQI
jgi:hypothetical protein